MFLQKSVIDLSSPRKTSFELFRALLGLSNEKLFSILLEPDTALSVALLIRLFGLKHESFGKQQKDIINYKGNKDCSIISNSWYGLLIIIRHES